MSFFRIKNYLMLTKTAAFLMAAMSCVLFIFPIRGYADDSSMASLSVTQKLYHKHVGTEGVYGGCYTKEKTTSKQVEKECGGVMVYWPELGTSSCQRCGAGYTGDQSGRKCFKTTSETITERTYVLGCDKTESTSVGTVSVKKSTNDWTKQVILSASYNVTSGVSIKQKAYIWNGTASENSEFCVRENGTYTLQLNTGANVNGQKTTVTILVNNIDVTPPGQLSYQLTPAKEWTKEEVLLADATAVDLQPDGSGGCGLNELPFSYDGGKTWTDRNSFSYTENGSYEIRVRDKLENTFAETIQISGIDRTPPSVNVEYEQAANQSQITINVNATDRQPDGSNGCGLAEHAYSFDGGKSWTNLSSHLVKKNCVLTIAVRDKLGNTYYTEERIGNIDQYGPQLIYSLKPEAWTNEEVTLSLAAQDINPNGENGVGIPQEWYSLDEGKSWKSENELKVLENQTLEIVLRDLHDNQTQRQIKIDYIDRNVPQVELSTRKVKKGNEVRIEILVEASDRESGLDDNAFSWDGGKIYSDQKSITVSKNGEYSVVVRDRAGNIGKATAKVEAFAQEKEESSQSEETDEEPDSREEANSTEESSFTEEPTSTEPTSLTEEMIEENEAEERAEPESEEETESETVFVSMEDLGDEPEYLPKKEMKKKKSMDLSKWITLLLAGCFSILLALLILLVWLRSMVVYVKNRKDEWCYLGRLWIGKNEEKYTVKISDAMIAKCETTRFCFKPAWGFVQMHDEEEMYFYFPEEICMTHRICEKMQISLL